ncbi:50S ribosomal protein L29 [bacterium]|nr:50S ribosomal protein L29 [bacterium]
MNAQEFRQLSVEELKGRLKQFKEELVRSRFKVQSSEARDTSVFKKIKRDVARAQTVLTEKLMGIEVVSKKSVVADKPKKAKKASKGSKEV